MTTAVYLLVLLSGALVSAQNECPLMTSLVGDRITYRWLQTKENVLVESTADHFLYDLKRKKFSLKQGWSDVSQSYSIWQIFDFADHKLYTIRDSRCISSALDEPFQVFCLPKGFNIDFWKSIIGILKPLDEHVIPTGEYVYGDSDHRNVTTHAIWAVFAYPLLQHRFGLHEGEVVLEESFFQNLSTEEPDSSAFQPPSFCQD